MSDRKDVMFTLFLSMVGLGFGHIYIGGNVRKRGIIILIAQVVLLLSVGVMSVIKPQVSRVLFTLVFVLGMGSFIDAFVSVKAHNNYFS